MRHLLGLVVLCSPLAGASLEADETERAPQTITNSIGMKLTLIPAGSFTMGSYETAERIVEAFGADPKFRKHFENERPRHDVRLSEPFYLGVHDVMVGQFRRFVNVTNYVTDAEKDAQSARPVGVGYTWRAPGYAQGEDHPAVCISHNDATGFLRWLSREEKREYRLPTEAEWEYACRAGSAERYCFGADPEGLAKYGNVADGNSSACGTALGE